MDFPDSLKVEFHCHTYVSKDSLTRPRDLIAMCKRKQIDRVIVTDHNEIRGALEAQSLDPERVIVGEEVKTTAGELLAAYVKERVPPRLSPEETIAALREQGAFISVSHPFDHQRSGWLLPDLIRISPLVDAIEVYNSRCLAPRANEQAKSFAVEHHLPGTVGSDAHTTRELGAATLRIPYFNGTQALSRVLWQAKPEVRLLSAWVHWSSAYARMVKAFNQRDS